MSDSHDHHHGPGGHHHDDHDHDHGPGGHTHGPGGLPAKPVSAPLPEAFAPSDDASSQALSDALRSSFVIVRIIMVILVVIFFFSGMVTVPPQKNAIILRFGKPVGGGEAQLLGPGLHWAFPAPIDEVVEISARQIQTVTSTIGWYAVSAEDEAAGREPGGSGSLNPANDGYTLTSDGNIIHVRARANYLISDPVAYTFNFVSTSNLVQNALNNALNYASARYTVDKALRHDRTGYKELVESRFKNLLLAQKLGVSLEVLVIEAVPPRDVKDAFNAVIDAEQDFSKNLNTAQGYTNQILSKAQGEAEAIINGGKADANKLLQSVQADAKSFADQLPLYQANPHLFMQRRLTETMQRVMTNAQAKWFLPERADGQQRELRLLLNPEPEGPKSPQP
jgi:membrane protease subunit HflK